MAAMPYPSMSAAGPPLKRYYGRFRSGPPGRVTCGRSSGNGNSELIPLDTTYWALGVATVYCQQEEGMSPASLLQVLWDYDFIRFIVLLG
jgi:hypothetical protein